MNKVSLVVVLICVGLFLCMCSASICSSSSESDDYEIVAIAETIIKSKLKSPSTADFCSVSECSVSNSGDTWTVKGWVDAQNGFGASIRSNYSVTFEYYGSSYKVISWDID